MEEGPQPAVRVWFWRVWTVVGVLVALAAAFWLLRGPLGVVAAPLAMAALIVYLLNPAVTALNRRGLPRLLGTALSYALAIGGLVLLLVSAGPILAQQTGEFLERVPDILASIQQGTNAQLARIGLPPLVTIDLGDNDTREAIATWFQENRDQVFTLVGIAGSVIGRALHLLLVVVLGPILAFYALSDWPRIRDGAKRLVPPNERVEMVDVAQRIGRMVGSYFRGQLLVATFVGAATSLGLLAIGLPFWALVGITAGVFNLIPLIGPFVGGLIGVIIALTVGGGLGQAVAVVVVMTVVQQIDNHVITPNVMARTVKIHPITVILALLVAGTTYGILGMVVAIPAVAALKLVTMYVLVTRVPSMRHLAGERGELFDEVSTDPPPDSGLIAMGRELRAAWERRRSREGDHAAHGLADPAVDGEPERRAFVDLVAAETDPEAATTTED